MNKGKFALTLLIIQIAQTTIFSRVAIFDAKANLVLAFVVAMSIIYGEKWGSYTGLGLGLLEDIMYTNILGVRALIYFVVGHLVGRAMQNNSSYLPGGIFITLVATVVSHLIHWLILFFLGQPITMSWYIKGPIFVEVILNAILFVLVMYLIKKFLKPDSVRKYTGY